MFDKLNQEIKSALSEVIINPNLTEQDIINFWNIVEKKLNECQDPTEKQRLASLTRSHIFLAELGTFKPELVNLNLKTLRDHQKTKDFFKRVLQESSPSSATINIVKETFEDSIPKDIREAITKLKQIEHITLENVDKLLKTLEQQLQYSLNDEPKKIEQILRYIADQLPHRRNAIQSANQTIKNRNTDFFNQAESTRFFKFRWENFSSIAQIENFFLIKNTSCSKNELMLLNKAIFSVLPYNTPTLHYYFLLKILEHSIKDQDYKIISNIFLKEFHNHLQKNQLARWVATDKKLCNLLAELLSITELSSKKTIKKHYPFFEELRQTANEEGKRYFNDALIENAAKNKGQYPNSLAMKLIETPAHCWTKITQAKKSFDKISFFTNGYKKTPTTASMPHDENNPKSLTLEQIVEDLTLQREKIRKDGKDHWLLKEIKLSSYKASALQALIDDIAAYSDYENKKTLNLDVPENNDLAFALRNTIDKWKEQKPKQEGLSPRWTRFLTCFQNDDTEILSKSHDDIIKEHRSRYFQDKSEFTTTKSMIEGILNALPEPVTQSLGCSQ